MHALRPTSGQVRRFFLSALILYLFGVIGILAPTHRHEGASHSHPDCQLCQVSAEAYLAPVALACPEAPVSFQSLAEQGQEPSLSVRHQPFSSRGPPSV